MMNRLGDNADTKPKDSYRRVSNALNELMRQLQKDIRNNGLQVGKKTSVKHHSTVYVLYPGSGHRVDEEMIRQAVMNNFAGCKKIKILCIDLNFYYIDQAAKIYRNYPPKFKNPSIEASFGVVDLSNPETIQDIITEQDFFEEGSNSLFDMVYMAHPVLASTRGEREPNLFSSFLPANRLQPICAFEGWITCSLPDLLKPDSGRIVTITTTKQEMDRFKMLLTNITCNGEDDKTPEPKEVTATPTLPNSTLQTLTSKERHTIKNSNYYTHLIAMRPSEFKSLEARRQFADTHTLLSTSTTDAALKLALYLAIFAVLIYNLSAATEPTHSSFGPRFQ